ERDGTLVAGREMAHDDARQAVLALQANEPVGEHDIRDQIDAGTMRDEIAPVRASGIAERRPHDLEILGAVGIGPQHQRLLSAQGWVMLYAVLDRSFAWRDEGRSRLGVGEIQKP